MSPSVTRSGRVLTKAPAATLGRRRPLSPGGVPPVSTTSARPGNVAKTTRKRKKPAAQALQAVDTGVPVRNNEEEADNAAVEEAQQQLQEREVDATFSNDALETGAAVFQETTQDIALDVTTDETASDVDTAGVDHSDTIEIVSETVNNSVIDLTDDIIVTNSPIRLGGSWLTTPTSLSRLPPHPWVDRTHAQPPVMVDLTDSPANTQDMDTMDDISMQELDTASSPGGGISLQCPVCLESLKTLKKSGVCMMSTMCGHIFCSRCLPASLRASGRCPTCRRMIRGGEYHKIFI